MKKESILVTIIGLVLGIGLTLTIQARAVNTPETDIVRYMGSRYQNTVGNRMGMMGNIDRHFIENMIPHHNDAIIMAELALTKSHRNEIRKLSQDIIRTQREEIESMKQWYITWFGTDVPTSGASMGMGMMGRGRIGMMGNGSDAPRLESAADFDKVFIEEMIPHHRMAVMMATMLLCSSTRDEMTVLAEQIITAQTKEINDMKLWYNAWGY